jgi:hypothetical protein
LVVPIDATKVLVSEKAESGVVPPQFWSVKVIAVPAIVALKKWVLASPIIVVTWVLLGKTVLRL